MKKNLLTALALVPVFALSQFTNGPLSTGATSASGATAPAGYTWSEAAANTGNTTEANANSGYACSKTTTTDYFCADNFVIPAGDSWFITSIAFFGYQTGYTDATPPMNKTYIQILNNTPGSAAATVVFGDEATNRFTSATDANMYRLFHSTIPTTSSVPNTLRKIWQVHASTPVTLQAGTYWVQFQLEAISSTATIWTPPVTTVGSRGLASDNALQRDGVAGTWAAVIDVGTPSTAPDYPQDFPFIISYTSLGTGEVLQYDNRVQVYPNPATDFFKISLPADSKNKKTLISVVDMSGKLVKELIYADQYDVRDLTPGTYLLKINDGVNVKTAKLVKK